MTTTIGKTMSDHVPTTDQALVASVRDGDAAAREALARRVGDAAYVFALQLTRGSDAASDVAQESVLRFFRHLDGFDADRSIDPWLYQIVRNQTRDLNRRNRLRQHESLDQLVEARGSEPPDLAADPAADAERGELRTRVWRAISELGDSHREIIVLRDYHDLSYREIAEVLRIPQGTVMSRLHAARKSLRNILTQGGPL